MSSNRLDSASAVSDMPETSDPTARTLVTVWSVLGSFEKDCVGAEMRELQLVLAVARKAAEDAMQRLGVPFRHAR